MSATLSASASASASAGAHPDQPPSFKIVGLILAISSGFLIGASFVIKKKGLLSAQKKSGAEAGEGHAYLKSVLWWTGMILMILGELCNFGAYAFTEALLVTPLGAISVVVGAILSHFFLKEKLTFFGWIGCALCIFGSTIIALNSPEQSSVTTIREFQKLFIAPGFLVWAGVCIVGSVFAVFFLVPRYGKTKMLVHIGICSAIGGLSVSCTQALGSSIVTSIRGNNQFTYWFTYFLLVFVVVTLLTEINYLNKALELFNTAMVTPTYFVLFTSATLLSSIILYQGLKATPIQIVTIVIGFFVICGGIIILQLSRVDPESLVTLDRKSTVLLAAQRPVESQEEWTDEERKYLGPEEAGMGLGAASIGGIMRARSRRASIGAASSSGTRRHDSTSTLGLRDRHSQASGVFDPRDPFSLNAVRYQLSDPPLNGPNRLLSPKLYDAPVKSYQTSSDSPVPVGASFSANVVGPKRSDTALRFDPEDTIHQPGRAGHPEEAQHSRAIHEGGHAGPQYINHPPASLPMTAEEPEQQARRFPGFFKSRSSATDPGSLSPNHDGGYNSPLYDSPSDFEPRAARSKSSTSSEGHRDRDRSAQRKAYPSLKKQEERDAELRGERRGLVGHDSPDEGDSDPEAKDDDLDDLFITAPTRRT